MTVPSVPSNPSPKFLLLKTTKENLEVSLYVDIVDIKSVQMEQGKKTLLNSETNQEEEVDITLCKIVFAQQSKVKVPYDSYVGGKKITKMRDEVINDYILLTDKVQVDYVSNWLATVTF